MHPWIQREADAIARRAERELEALVAVSSPSGDVHGAEECAARPRAWTLIVPAALRRTTTPSAPSAVSSPASKQRHASQPAKRSTWPNGAVRHSSSQTSRSATSA